MRNSNWVTPFSIAGYKEDHEDIMFSIETLRHEELSAALQTEQVATSHICSGFIDHLKVCLGHFLKGGSQAA